jgi:phosphatidylglycerol---prolipoprotein diacylglyceryl transferase
MILLHQLDPIAFTLGQLKVHWYGIMYMLGFTAAWFLGRARVRAGRLPGIDEDAYNDLMFYSMLGVIFGARIGSILFYDLDVYLAEPLLVFKIWRGGMSFHGGLLGVLAAVLWWSRKYRMHFFDIVDFVAPLVPPGLGFGRLGNFINGELWGKYTQGGWGMVFPYAEDSLARLDPPTLAAMHASGALDQYARHPSQLYQMTLEGIVLFCVLWWFSRKPRRRYAVAGMFALLYGLFRFPIEFIRVPDEGVGYIAFDWLTRGQLLTLPMLVFGAALLWASRKASILPPASAPQSPARDTASGPGRDGSG